MIRFLLSAFTCLVFWNISVGQELSIDSLLGSLRTRPDDTVKVALLLSIGDQYEYNQPDSAIFYYRHARNLSQRLNYSKGFVQYMLARQHLMNIQGQYDSALMLCMRATELARKLDDEELLASSLGNLGSVYLYMGDKEKAIDYYLQCATILEKLGNKKKLAVLYTNLCINYQRLKQHTNSLTYGTKAITMARQLETKEDLGIALTNQAVTLLDINRRAEALPLLEEALLISRQINFTRLELSVLINMAGTIEGEPGGSQRYKTYIDEALNLSRKMDEKTGLAISLRCLADYYFHEGDLIKATQHAMQSLQITREFDNREDEVKALTLLSYISARGGDMDSYHRYRVQADTLRNHLVNQDLARNINELEMKYETRKKE